MGIERFISHTGVRIPTALIEQLREDTLGRAQKGRSGPAIPTDVLSPTESLREATEALQKWLNREDQKPCN